MGNLGFPELLVIAVVALLVFGPDRLPELARQAGKALAKFRAETARSVAELKQAADIEDLDRELRSLKSDLRDVRSGVSRALLAEPGGSSRTGSSRTGSSRGGAATSPAADSDDEPAPPTDLEAT